MLLFCKAVEQELRLKIEALTAEVVSLRAECASLRDEQKNRSNNNDGNNVDDDEEREHCTRQLFVLDALREKEVRTLGKLVRGSSSLGCVAVVAIEPRTHRTRGRGKR